jgi:hypothetical protein
MLTITPETAMQVPDSLGVEFVRVEYDVESVAKAVEASLLPDEYADMLRKAY